MQCQSRVWCRAACGVQLDTSLVHVNDQIPYLFRIPITTQGAQGRR